MKKIQSLILALAVLAGLFTGAVPAGAEAGLTLDEGYEIVDTAYSSTLGYMISAKDYANYTNTSLPTKLYNSKDGVKWTLVRDESTAYNNANKYSSQQLVWWEEAEAFVLSRGANAIYSKDLSTWTDMPNTVRNNAMIEAEGDTLMSSGGRAARYPTSSNYAGSATVQHYCFAPSSANANTVAVGMTPKDASGNRTYLHITNSYFWLHSSADCTSAEISTSKVTKQAVTAFGSNSYPVDVKYSADINGWVIVNKTPRLYTIATDGAWSNFVAISDETNITAVGADANTVIIGTGDGKLYYAPSADGIGINTVWTEITGSGMTDEVRSITKTADGAFIVASKSKVFEIKSNMTYAAFSGSEEPVEQKLEIGTPYVVQAGDTITAYIPYVNTVEDKPAVMYTAVYDGERLVKVESSAGTLVCTESLTEQTLRNSITISTDGEEDYTMKVMLWDNNQKPYTSDTAPVFK